MRFWTTAHILDPRKTGTSYPVPEIAGRSRPGHRHGRMGHADATFWASENQHRSWGSRKTNHRSFSVQSRLRPDGPDPRILAAPFRGAPAAYDPGSREKDVLQILLFPGTMFPAVQVQFRRRSRLSHPVSESTQPRRGTSSISGLRRTGRTLDPKRKLFLTGFSLGCAIFSRIGDKQRTVQTLFPVNLGFQSELEKAISTRRRPSWTKDQIGKLTGVVRSTRLRPRPGRQTTKQEGPDRLTGKPASSTGRAQGRDLARSREDATGCKMMPVSSL